MKLTGDRNICPGCGLPFNSSFAFDKHRHGDFGLDRRCLTVPEMQAKKMDTNAQGFWVSEKRAIESIPDSVVSAN